MTTLLCILIVGTILIFAAGFGCGWYTRGAYPKNPLGYSDEEIRKILSPPTVLVGLHGKESLDDALKEAQRRSFAYGNCKLDNENITRKMINQEAEKLKTEKK